MAKSFEILLARMSPDRRERIEQEAQELLAEIALQDLRQALGLTQAQVAEVTAGNQPQPAGTGDVYVASLRQYIEALGGHLKLVASFPDREVEINQTY